MACQFLLEVILNLNYNKNLHCEEQVHSQGRCRKMPNMYVSKVRAGASEAVSPHSICQRRLGLEEICESN